MESAGKRRLNTFKLFTSVFIICFFTVIVYSQTHNMPNPLLPPYFTQENDSINDPVYTIAEQQPSFIYKDGRDFIESYTMYLKNSLRYPSSNGCHGKVFVEFIVEKDGSLNNLRELRGMPDCPEDYEYNKEAISVLLNMPKWTPGKQTGNNVRVRMILPVDFN